MSEVILALAGLADESDLVRAADVAGLRVVRRCVDSVDLLAAAAMAPECAVAVSAGLPRLTPDVVARLGDRLVIGLAADALGSERLRRMGVDPVIGLAPSSAVTMQQVADVCSSARRPAASAPSVDTSSIAPAVQGPREWAGGTDRSPVPMGRLVAVWGPLGSPGRTTVALGIAERLAEEGRRVCLVDGDTYGPSITLALGLVEEASGLVVACRHGETGPLPARRLASLTMVVPVSGPGHWRVLGGLPDAGRWRDLRAPALDRVWQAAREAFDVTIVDIGFCLESAEDAGVWSRERNAAALTAIGYADRIVAVGEASVLGAARMASGLGRLAEVAPGVPVTVVRNRAQGSDPSWVQAVATALPSSVEAAALDVPDDPRAVRTCWARARALGEGARRSRIRRSMATIAAHAVSG